MNKAERQRLKGNKKARAVSTKKLKGIYVRSADVVIGKRLAPSILAELNKDGEQE